jgi:putative peptidoglycan lipid II flippase
MGALVSSLVPVLVETRQKRGMAGAGELLSTMVSLSALGLMAVAALLGLLAPYYLPWVGHGFSTAKLHLTRELLYALLPFVCFGGIAALLSSALNAMEIFALPSLAPLVTPLITIAFILGLAGWGPFTLAGGVVAGSLIEAALLFFVLHRHGVRLNFRWNGLGSAARNVAHQYFPLLGAGFLMGSTSLVDQAMAAILPGGSVSALSYANKIVGAVLVIGGTALTTAAFPYFSRMAAENDWPGLRHTLKRYSLLVASATVPFALLLMAFSRPLIRLLFQRGAFLAADTELVSQVQICYALQIPFYIWSLLFVRFLCAIRHNNILLYVAAMNLVVDILLNLALMRVWGVAGIALSTSLVNVISFLAVALYSVRVLARQPAPAVVAAPSQPAVF